mmetsp:Transcript_147211/g.472836  ORF Transcript_147211/g.472836 Transcript_147211/m.472836 type:complete len:766 (-) Transcript_147211:84-2381(-)
MTCTKSFRRGLRTSAHRVTEVLLKHRRLGFDDVQTEQAFTDQLAHQVAVWTVVGHSLAFVVHAVNILWSVREQLNLPGTPPERFDWDSDDFRTSYYWVVLTFLMVQSVLCMTFGALAHFFDATKMNWELISVLWTSFVAIFIPWLNQWHLSRLAGHGDPTELWHVHTEEYESLRIIALVSITMSYATYVPIRARFVWVLPLSCAVSITLMFMCLGSYYADSVPYKVLTLFFLLFLPIPGKCSHEQLVRQRWRALRQVRSAKSCVSGMERMSGMFVDIVFSLTDSMHFVGTDVLPDSFFGQKVAGVRFTDFMHQADRNRFRDLIFRMSTDGLSLQSIPLTLNLPSGLIEVSLYITMIGEAPESSDAKYLVSLKNTSDALTGIMPRCNTEGTDAFDEDWWPTSAENLQSANFFIPGTVGGVGGSGGGSWQKILVGGTGSAGGSFASEGRERLTGGGGMTNMQSNSASTELSFALSEESTTASSFDTRRPCIASSVPTALLAEPAAKYDWNSLPPIKSEDTLPRIDDGDGSKKASSEAGSQSVRSMQQVWTKATSSGGAQTADLQDMQAFMSTCDDFCLKKEMGVNTSLVWSKDGFTCKACARPPKLPGGPAPRPTPRRQRRRRDHGQQNSEQNDANKFDGRWVISAEEAPGASAWMACFEIRGVHVILGDGDKDRIRSNQSGEPTLCGGALHLESPDCLKRRGKSGRCVAFYRMRPSEDAVLNEEVEEEMFDEATPASQSSSSDDVEVISDEDEVDSALRYEEAQLQ